MASTRIDPRAFLPLKDLVFRILVALADGERHGWGLVQALEERSAGEGGSTGGGRGTVLPGHLYRTLNRMLDDGLVEETDAPSEPTVPRPGPGTTPSRFFKLTPLGIAVARAETERLSDLVARSRAGKLLRERR